MPEMIRLTKIMLQFLIISMIMAPTLCQNGTFDNSTSKKFILDIYPNKAGDALVIGYADNLNSLPFLRTSEYKYNNETRQLFALTEALTRKDGDLWTLRFALLGRIDRYYTAFYLPSDVKLKEVNQSTGLGNLISMRNDSLVVEVQGYEVQDPMVTIEYQQPLMKTDEINNQSYIYTILLIVFLAIGSTFLITQYRKRGQKAVRSEIQQNDSLMRSAKTNREPEVIEQNSMKSVQITSELEAVMRTLTENELSVLKTLLNHGGRMTQADLRYETDKPKSSLSEILLSLEKRKIITKREMGRTNLIELSETFILKSGHS